MMPSTTIPLIDSLHRRVRTAYVIVYCGPDHRIALTIDGKISRLPHYDGFRKRKNLDGAGDRTG